MPHVKPGITTTRLSAGIFAASVGAIAMIGWGALALASTSPTAPGTPVSGGGWSGGSSVEPKFTPASLLCFAPSTLTFHESPTP